MSPRGSGGGRAREEDPILRAGELFQTAAGDPDTDVYLYRIEPKTRRAQGPAYLEKFTGGAQPTLDEIREEFGGGTFRAIAKKGSAIQAKSEFTIEGSPRIRGGEIIENAGAYQIPQGRSAFTGGDGSTAARIAELEEEIARLRGNGHYRAPISEEEETRRESREFRRLVREHLFLRQLTAEVPAAHDPLALVERVLDVVHRLRADADSGPEWQDTLAQAALRFLESPPAAPVLPAPAPAPAAPTAPAQAAAPTTPGVPTMPNDEQIRTLQVLRRVIAAARANEDPASLVPWAVEVIEPAMREAIPRMNASQFVGVFQSMPFPDFREAPIVEWLSRFHAALHSELSADAREPSRAPDREREEPDPQPPPPPAGPGSEE